MKGRDMGEWILVGAILGLVGLYLLISIIGEIAIIESEDEDDQTWQ
jgi:hypothetical protein